MSLERVAAGVGHTLSRTADPLARVLLGAVLDDMCIMYVPDEPVHVAHVAVPATFPCADGDLLLEVVLLGARVNGRAGNVAVRVL
jgi:hypothetical protein